MFGRIFDVIPVGPVDAHVSLLVVALLALEPLFLALLEMGMGTLLDRLRAVAGVLPPLVGGLAPPLLG